MADLHKNGIDQNNSNNNDRLSDIEQTKIDLSKDLIESLEPRNKNDRDFVEKHKNNKDIEWNKIKFAKSYIEIDGIKFPRKLAQKSDISNFIRWLDYHMDGDNMYVTMDGFQKLQRRGANIVTGEQRQSAAKVFGGDLALVGELLHYPKLSYIRGEVVSKGDVCELWTPREDGHLFNITFNGKTAYFGHAAPIAGKYPSTPIVLLKD